MDFFTLLMALALLQLWGSGGPLQQDAWFDKLTHYATEQQIEPVLRLLLVVALPCVALLLVLVLVDSFLFGLLSLLIYIAVLLFSLGRGEFGEIVQRYLLHWNSGQLDRAEVCAKAIISAANTQMTGTDKVDEGGDILSAQIALHRSMRGALVYGSFERWFAVVFWFMLLGPAAALAYRLSSRAGGNEGLGAPERELAQRLTYYAEWLPVRLLTLAFALTGNFVGGFNSSWQSLWQTQANVELLENTALAAINGEQALHCYPDSCEQMTVYGREQLLAIQALMQRSGVCWIVVIALFEMFI